MSLKIEHLHRTYALFDNLCYIHFLGITNASTCPLWFQSIIIKKISLFSCYFVLMTFLSLHFWFLKIYVTLGTYTFCGIGTDLGHVVLLLLLCSIYFLIRLERIATSRLAACKRGTNVKKFHTISRWLSQPLLVASGNKVNPVY